MPAMSTMVRAIILARSREVECGGVLLSDDSFMRPWLATWKQPGIYTQNLMVEMRTDGLIDSTRKRIRGVMDSLWTHLGSSGGATR